MKGSERLKNAPKPKLRSEKAKVEEPRLFVRQVYYMANYWLLHQIYYCGCVLKITCIENELYQIGYHISANSFRGNYSFFNLTLCTVTFGRGTYRCGNYSREETIQGRKQFPEIRYFKKNQEWSIFLHVIQLGSQTTLIPFCSRSPLYLLIADSYLWVSSDQTFL